MMTVVRQRQLPEEECSKCGGVGGMYVNVHRIQCYRSEPVEQDGLKGCWLCGDLMGEEE